MDQLSEEEPAGTIVPMVPEKNTKDVLKINLEAGDKVAITRKRTAPDEHGAPCEYELDTGSYRQKLTFKSEADPMGLSDQTLLAVLIDRAAFRQQARTTVAGGVMLDVLGTARSAIYYAYDAPKEIQTGVGDKLERPAKESDVSGTTPADEEA